MKQIHLLALAIMILLPCTLRAADRPNVVWLTSEDNGPHLGCYGDSYSHTPDLDELARRGMRYVNAWSTAPVCAPARTVIVTGMWAPSLGAEHMRSQVRLPEAIKAYPQYLREAGYYCTNNSKTDYNVAVDMDATWDASSDTAHWKNRREGQPFFAVFNSMISHESQIRNAINEEDRIHDPAKVHVPAYHPDTPEVRKDWAQYYDRLTMMDRQCGERLRELREAGLDEDTIIFYYSDHGSGMPRNKRSACNSGLNVPLIVYVPPKWRHLAPADYVPGGSSDRLVSFYDLAPTLLNICGVQPPFHMHGKPFMGEPERIAPEPQFAFGFRGRMDERFDMVRTVRDKRFVYVRNFMPHKPAGQYLDYMFQTPTTRVWKSLFDAKNLNEAQVQFWIEKPSEALYDLQSDRDEVHNLADSPDYQKVVQRMRTALRRTLFQWRDLGFLPEGEIHSRAADDAPWTIGQDDARFPMEKIVVAAELASSLEFYATEPLMAGLVDEDSAVRYWSALGLLMRKEPSVNAARAVLHSALSDSSPAVRVIAAEALGRFGDEDDQRSARDLLVEHSDLAHHDTFTAMLALNALLELAPEELVSVHDRISTLPEKREPMPPRMEQYVARLLQGLRSDR